MRSEVIRTAYRVLAYLVALEIVIQAAAISFAIFGFGKWIQDRIIGFMIHGLNRQFLVPLIALLLLIVSFFAKVPKGVMWAGLVFLLVIVQVLLGIFGGGIPALGLLHGLNALALFTVALVAARQAGSTSTAGAVTPARHATSV